jgi:hypothetical protein
VPAWATGMLATLGVALIIHSVNDVIQFVRLKRDVKWMKAVMRSKGMVAPNGDDD